ncbi:MAG: hypothetical protein DIU74_003490 [Pseudomonadota bacterium]|nr:MAG: hypothetical protein DIU74_07575 [Pseudomonadota bacterium]
MASSPDKDRKRASRAQDQSPWADWDDSVLGAESAFPPTVIGWDNPAADEKNAGDRWAHVAAMIEAQRAEARAARARSRRIALGITAVAGLVALVATLQLFVA